MLVRNILITLAACLMAAPEAVAEYVKATYPQTPKVVQSVEISAPDSVPLGGRVTINLTVNASGAMAPDRKLFLYLMQPDELNTAWHVETIEPRPASSQWKAGANRLQPFTFTVPADIPTGDFRIVVGVHTQGFGGEKPVRVTGNQASRIGKIITRGQMVDKYGVPHEWHLNHAHTMIWDGEPYIPIGGMFVYDRDWNVVKAQIDAMKQHGIRDIYLHLGVNQPYVWLERSDDDFRFFQQTIDYLDDNDFRYGIQFQALEARGNGWYYPGRGPRVEVTESGTVQAQEERVKSAYFAVYDMATQEIVQVGKARVSEEKYMEADVELPREGRFRVVFTCERDAPGGYSMYWWDEAYDNYVAKVHSHYSKVNLGPGFRFIVDPLWNEMNVNRDFFPSAARYRQWMASWLQKRYGTIDRLNAAWKPLDKQVESFEQAGRLIPLDRFDSLDGEKILQWLLDPETGTVIQTNLRDSQSNYDWQECLGRGLLHYVNDMADEWKKIYDVPVIYKGFSDMDHWHINDVGTATGHDGLGMESYGNGEPMMLFMAGHLYGELQQATKTQWLIVTESAEGNHMDNSPSRNKMPGYTSRIGHMYANINGLISGGAKGFFHYNMISGRAADTPWTDALMVDPRQLEWLATYSRAVENTPGLADYKPIAYFRYPGLYNPNAMNLYSEPAKDYYNLGGWWWREPIGKSEDGIWILPTFSLLPDTPLFLVNLENIPGSQRHADEVRKAIRDNLRITVIGYRKDLGTLPEIDRFYTSEYSRDSDGRQFQVLKPGPRSQVLGRNAQGQVWNLREGNLQINSKQVFGQHGYQPADLGVTSRERVDSYWGVFEEVLGITILNLGEKLDGLHFDDAGTPVTVVQTKDSPQTLTFDIPAGAQVTARYSNGTPAGRLAGGRLVVDLEPVDMTLIRYDEWEKRDQHRFVLGGILIDSIDAKDSVIIEGLPLSSATPKEAASAALDEARKSLARVPVTHTGSLERVIATAENHFNRGAYAQTVAAATDGLDEWFRRNTPYIWIEAEDYKASNFNYSKMGGITPCSGAAIIALQTAVEPPLGNGWYASYEFDAPEDGTYQLWLRENYLSFSSPSSYRIDDGPWVRVPNTLVPHDSAVVALYNALEDTRQVFAWYHYGEVQLKRGKHTITFRVTEPRGKGTSVTMADNRPYAKLVDVILLTRQGFVPDGPAKPRYISTEVRESVVNLAPSPSFEFRPWSNMPEPRGWMRSESSDDVRWQDAGWGFYNVMPGVGLDVGQRYAYVGQRNLTIKPGGEVRHWRSNPIEVRGGVDYQFESFIRTAMRFDSEVTVGVEWLDASGGVIASQLETRDGEFDWTHIRFVQTSPPGTAAARLVFQVAPGTEGFAYFDDVVFAEFPAARQVSR